MLVEWSSALIICWCCVRGGCADVKDYMFICSNTSHTVDVHAWMSGHCHDSNLVNFYKDCTLLVGGLKWHCWDCSCYFFSPTSLVDHHHAKRTCEVLDAQLLTIQSEQENGYIWDAITTHGYTPVPNNFNFKAYYMGWYDGGWQDGTSVTYTKWLTYLGFWKCAVFGTLYPSKAKWQSKDCNAKHAYICERPFPV